MARPSGRAMCEQLEYIVNRGGGVSRDKGLFDGNAGVFKVTGNSSLVYFDDYFVYGAKKVAYLSMVPKR